MKSRFLLILILLPFISYTQLTNEQLVNKLKWDSIIENPNSPDTSLAKAYLALSEILYISNIDTVLPLCKKIEEIVKQNFHSKSNKTIPKSLKNSLAGAYNNIGFVYQFYGDINLALDYYNKGLKIRKEINDEEGLSSSYNNIGMVYVDKEDISLALEYYHKGLKISEKNSNYKSMATLYNNIGFIHNNQGDINTALSWFYKSLKIREQIEDKKGVSNTYNNIAGVLVDKGDLELALDYYHKSREIREEIGDRKGLATSYNNIAGILRDKGDVTTAFNYFKKSLEIREKINDKEGIAISYKNIGNLFLTYYKELGLSRQNAQNQAKLMGERGFAIAKEIRFPKIILYHSALLYQVAYQQGDYKTAIEMRNLEIQMSDSINNIAAHKATAQQEAKYEYEKQKAINDAEYEKQLAIEKEAKAKQKIITYATAGGLGLVGIFLIFVFNRLHVTRKQKNIIEQQKEDVEIAHGEITDSIQYAKRIQNAILPSDKLVKEYLQESFILYKPKDIVAGDFYWMEHKDNKVLFAAADCTGHGVPGAMVSVVCNNGLNRSVREYGLTDPGKILDKTREIVVEEFEKSEEEVKDGMDIALCSLSIDSNQSTVLQYAGAHNPLWIIRNGELLETKANKQPIGQFDNPESYTTHTIELQEGDSLYIFSDGYADQFGGEKGKKMKTANFKKLLLSIQKENMQKQKELIDEAFESWKGDLEQLDDVCVIGVRV